MAYDLAVAYRIYPGVSKPSRGLPFDDDKLRQAELCLRSFRRATLGLRVKLWAVMDSCPPEYEQMFRRYFDGPDFVPVHMQKAGNHQTFAMQIAILLEQDASQMVFLAEDDYLFVSSDFGLMIDFLSSGDGIDFISPFDHTDDYTLKLHNFPKRVRIFKGLHWRTAASTCLTFLTTKEQLARYEGVFRSYSKGNFDVSVWLALTKCRIFNPISSFLYNPEGKYFMMRAVLKAWSHGLGQILFGRRAGLWIPMPTFALHLDRFHEAPGFDMASEMVKEDQRSASLSLIENVPR